MDTFGQSYKGNFSILMGRSCKATRCVFTSSIILKVAAENSVLEARHNAGRASPPMNAALKNNCAKWRNSYTRYTVF